MTVVLAVIVVPTRRGGAYRDDIRIPGGAERALALKQPADRIQSILVRAFAWSHSLALGGADGGGASFRERFRHEEGEDTGGCQADAGQHPSADG